MKRIRITAENSKEYKYSDSIHAAIVTALIASGANEKDVIGRDAKSWTFSPYQTIMQCGKKILRGLDISTSDKDLGFILAELDPREINHNSMNGDRIAMGVGKVQTLRNPIDDSGELRAKFISPFMLAKKESSGKEWINSLKDVNLSEAFSRNLSLRMGKSVELQVDIDAFTQRCAKPILVYCRKAKDKDIKLPAFLGTMNLKGEKEVLEEAYFGGLGQRIRYGFGCIAPVK